MFLKSSIESKMRRSEHLIESKMRHLGFLELLASSSLKNLYFYLAEEVRAFRREWEGIMTTWACILQLVPTTKVVGVAKHSRS